jgi:CBS-domain-containing membrane protein
VVALTADTKAVVVTASIAEVLREFDAGVSALPISDDAGQLVGWVRERDVLTALSLPAA